jgi:hypothetical protein
MLLPCAAQMQAPLVCRAFLYLQREPLSGSSSGQIWMGDVATNGRGGIGGHHGGQRHEPAPVAGVRVMASPQHRAYGRPDDSRERRGDFGDDRAAL